MAGVAVELTPLYAVPVQLASLGEISDRCRARRGSEPRVTSRGAGYSRQHTWSVFAAVGLVLRIACGIGARQWFLAIR
jgi:hypothetical protein